MIKAIFIFVLLCLVFPSYILADDAEQLLQKVSAVTKKTVSLSGDYEIRLRHLEPYQEIREQGIFRLSRPNYLSITGWKLLPSKNGDRWERIADATSYISDGKFSYILYPKSNGISYQKINADADGKNVSINLQPIADFFDENNSFINQIARARSKNTLTSLGDMGKKVWENVSYRTIEFVTDEIEKGVSLHKSVQLYIGKDWRIYRVVSNEKLGDLISETETIFRNISSETKLAAKDFAYALPANAEPYVAPLPPLEAGTQIPDITLTDKNGKQLKLSDFQGKTIILDFWATWCQPCLKSFPKTAEVLKKVGEDKVVVIAVNIWDNPANSVIWAAKHPELNSFVFAVDTTNSSGKDSVALFQVSKLPLQYVISPTGKIVTHFEGYSGTGEELEKAIVSAQNLK